MKLPTLLFLLILLPISLTVAQVNITTIHTPYGNATVYTHRAQYYNNYGSSAGQAYRPKHKFYVEMKDGRQLLVHNVMDYYDSVAKLVLTRKSDSTITIRPNDTKLIVTMVYRTNERLEGIPADSCWLFKIVKGKINGYSPFAEKDDFVIAIQKGDDGAIVPLNPNNLAEMVGTDDPKINKLVEKKKLVNAIRAYNKTPDP